MKSLVYSVGILSGLLLLNACSTQNPVAFGNRKFYPDAVAKSTHRAEVSCAEAKNTIEKSAEKLILTDTVPGRTGIDQTVEAIGNVSEQTPYATPKPTMRERLALRALSYYASKAQDTHAWEESKKTPDTAILGLLLGLAGFLFFGVVLGPVAIILASIALAKPSNQYRKGLAILALIIGLVVLAIAIIG